MERLPRTNSPYPCRKGWMIDLPKSGRTTSRATAVRGLPAHAWPVFATESQSWLPVHRRHRAVPTPFRCPCDDLGGRRAEMQEAPHGDHPSKDPCRRIEGAPSNGQARHHRRPRSLRSWEPRSDMHVPAGLPPVYATKWNRRHPA